MAATRAGNCTSWTPTAASLPIPAANASTGADTSRAKVFRSPATCWRAPRVLDDTAQSLHRQRKPAIRATPDRGDARRRSRRRRQARQAIGGPSDPRRGGMVGARSARRRPRRSARRTRTPRTGQPRALGAFPANICRAATTRPGLPIARPSTPASKPRSRARNDRSPADRNRRFAGHLPWRRRPRNPCGRQRRSQRRQWRDTGAGRRIRLRQERDLARHHGTAVETFRRGHRLDPLRRFRSAGCARPDPARSPRQSPGDDLPGADDLAQSELHHRRPDHRDHPAPSRRIAAHTRASARSNCCAASTSPRRNNGSTNIRTSSRAACASAS